ncbi:hypothetical protein COU54_01210 [Candidatus Pacearchaeota archaeon CG10_big_fil_rev_8_21_14_0_10_31_24]|nr:MAG: hypothetical protein COU54_01210 [Candidatus Pacearchaeota archaeon CG10_big_fil_rev_8_21_14_0_10_31_24]
MTGKKINKKKRQIIKILAYITLFLILLLILLIFINILLRNEILLTSYQKDSLKNIFPQNHIESVRFYEGGLLSIGSTKTICKSIYILPNEKGKHIINNPESEEAILLIVHEVTHTFQGKRIDSCIKMSLSSLYAQFRAFLKYGSRNYAYYYPLNLSFDIFNRKYFYNPEQEASIIEDYYYLKFLDGNLSNTNCYDCSKNSSGDISCFSCDNYSKKYVLDNLENISLDILDKYK